MHPTLNPPLPGSKASGWHACLLGTRTSLAGEWMLGCCPQPGRTWQECPPSHGVNWGHPSDCRLSRKKAGGRGPSPLSPGAQGGLPLYRGSVRSWSGLMKFCMTMYSRRTIRQSSPSRAEATEAKKNLRGGRAAQARHHQGQARPAWVRGVGMPRVRPTAARRPSIHHPTFLGPFLPRLQADVTGRW